MYEKHWGLHESPFQRRRQPYFYLSPTHEECLARLRYLVDHRRLAGLLTGPGGSGRSTLLRYFAQQAKRSRCDVALVTALGAEPTGVCWDIAAGWGQNPCRTEPLFSLWRKITDRLTENRYQQRPALVLVDDADCTGAEVQALLLRLAKCEAAAGAPFTLVLVAGLRGMEKLAPGLRELIDLRLELEPWNAPETEAFLHDSLSKAGRSAPAFEPAAVRRLHELSQGVPRRVSRLAELALLAGAGQGLHQVDAQILDHVQQELGPLELLEV